MARSFKPGNRVTFPVIDRGINLTTGQRENGVPPVGFRGHCQKETGMLTVQFDGPIWLVKTKAGEVFKVHERQMAFAD